MRHNNTKLHGQTAGRHGRLSQCLPLMALACLLQASAPAEEATNACVNFSGTWLLDLKASKSESFTRIMELQGMGRIQRALLNNTAVNQEITQQGAEVLTIDAKAVCMSRREVQYLDGRETSGVNAMDQPVKGTSKWNDDRTAVISKAETKSADGKPSVMTITRTLSEDGQTMIQHIRYEIEGSEPLEARRVFNRQAEAK